MAAIRDPGVVDSSQITDRLRAEISFDDLVERARVRGRRSLRVRAARLRSKSWHVGQAAIAAGIAWFIAHHVIGHPAPVFAPIVAVVCLGMSYRQRLRRVAEVTVGVAVGVLVADVFVSIAGSGVWQVALVVATSMTIALLMDAGDLLIMQSAVQSIFVVTLAPAPGQTFTRWLDALVGGATALVAAAIVPSAPLRSPRVQAGGVARATAELLRGTAQAAREHDEALAAEVLGRARATEVLVRELQQAADEGLSVIASSPLRRGQRAGMTRVSDLVEPLDRALRSTRVLTRRMVAAIAHEQVPPSYLVVLDDLARAVEILSEALTDNAAPERGRSALLAVGRATGDLERIGGLSTEVVLAQVRSVVVDLLQVTGLDTGEALAALPPVRPVQAEQSRQSGQAVGGPADDESRDGDPSRG